MLHFSTIFHPTAVSPLTTLGTLSYHLNGQLAGVTRDGCREEYLWDGLALIRRGVSDFINEPAVTGGNPVLSGDKVLFNDILGNTLGVKDQSSYQPVTMTAFGESDNVDAFFTGKPYIGELGYAFLFRNYRPEQGKWQTADPLGYPDGWNNFAYVNNKVVQNFDRAGLCRWVSHSGSYIDIPTYGKDPKGHTPPGYTYEPCHSDVYVDESTYAPYVYIEQDIVVYCGDDPLQLAAEGYGGGHIAGFFPSVSYNCDKDLDEHYGYQIYHFVGTVYLNPVYEEYDCGIKIVAGYELPNSSFNPRYSLSVTCIYTSVCE